MARSRNIKPGFFKNEGLAECTPLSRILFAGLWCLADRKGRLEDRPKRIRAEILPYDDGSVDEMLDELHKSGFIMRYTIDGKAFIQVLNFLKHQNPHCKEQDSLIPAPDLNGARTVQEQDDHQKSTELARLIPDSLNLIPDSLNPVPLSDDNGCAQAEPEHVPVCPQKSPAGDPLACPAEEIVELYHEAMPTNPRCKVLNQSRRGAIKARWQEASRLICKPFGYKTRADGLKAWRTFFETCNESEFLTGQTTPLAGKPPFLADIDFLMSPNGFARCLENKYHRETV